MLTSYLVVQNKMIPEHHCLGVLTLTSQLQKLALIIYVSKKSILSHLCHLILLLFRLLPYARASVHVLTVQVEINLEKELVEKKTLSFSRNPKLCMLKMMMKEIWVRHWGNSAITSPTESPLLHFKTRKCLIT